MGVLQQGRVGAPAPRRFYTVTEVADMFGISDMTVYREIRAGKFPAVKIRGRYVIPAKVIDALESDAMNAGLVDVADYATENASGGVA